MKSAIIVGCGPSLDTSLIHSYHEAADWVVTVNRGFRAWDDYPHLYPCQIYLCDGPKAFEDCQEELIAYAMRTPLLVSRNPENAASQKDRWKSFGAKTVHEIPLLGFTDGNPFEKETLSYPKSSLLFAWQTLVRAGFDSIGLAGFDLGFEAGNRYFYEFQTMRNRDRLATRQSYQKQGETLKAWIPYAEDMGIKTFNLGPETSGLAKVMETLTLGQFVRSNSVVDTYREDENK